MDLIRWSYGPATVLEIIWTLAGLVGGLNVWLLFLAAYGDERFVRKNRLNGVRLLVARMSLRVEGVYLYIMVAFIVIGTFAMTQKPSNPDRQITPTGVVITVLFCSISALVNVDAAKRRNDRNRVMEIESERYMAAIRAQTEGHHA